MTHNLGALLGRAVAPILGICAFRLSAWSVFGGSYLGDTADAYSLSRLAQLAAIIVIMLASRPIATHRHAGLAGVGVAAGAMTLAALMCLGRGPQDPLFMVARLLHGTCSAVLIMAWGAYSCSVEPRRATVQVSVAFALYGALTFALQGAGEGVTGVVAVLAPAASGALFCATPDVRDTLGASPSLTARPRKGDAGKPVAQALRGVNWGAAALLFACCLVCSVSDVLITPGLTGTATYMANAFRVLAFAVLAGIFCAWVFALHRSDPDQLWPLFSCTIFFGLLGYSSFSFVNAEASVSFMRATQDCIMLFAWVFVSGTCYRQGLPRLVTFGLGATLLMRTDLIANLLGLAGAMPRGQADAGLAVALSFVMAAVLIVSTIALLWRGGAGADDAGRADARHGQAPASKTAPGGSDSPASRDEREPQVLDTPERPASDLAPLAPFELTARELQVVELMLRGYTLPQAGERLGVSLNTARYYAKTIYRKLGIHSKAELIALAEGTGTRR